MDIMKARLIFIGILTVLVTRTQTAMAQITNEEWQEYATPINSLEDGGQYFLYNMTQLKYVNAGGSYGMAAVLDNDNMGIRFTIHKNNNSYSFTAAIDNNGKNYLGFEPWVFGGYALDRSEGTFTLTASDNTKEKFKMRDSDNYYIKTEKRADGLFYTVRGNNNSNNADEWILVAVDTYFKIIQQSFLNSKDQTSLNISNLIINERFIRNAVNKTTVNGNTVKIWNGYINPGTAFTGDYSTLNTLKENKDFYLSIDHRFGAGKSVAESTCDAYADKYGKYSAGEIVNGVDGMLRQTIIIRTPGTYRIRAKAFYYNSGNDPKESNSYLFARTNGFEIPVIKGKDKENFEDTIESHIAFIKKKHNGDVDNVQITDENINEYFRYNAAAGEFLESFTNQENNPYSVEVSLTITQSDLGEKGELEIGLGAIKQTKEGYLFLNDVELFYQGNYEFGIDAYNKIPSNVKVYDNAVGRRFNLRRQFSLNKWNSLVLPVKLYAGHITSVFGQNARLLKLVGINPDRQTQILFEEIDLANGNNVAVEPGEMYLVYVTDDADEDKDAIYDFWLAGSDTPDTSVSHETVTYNGPIYHFAGVTSEKLESPIKTKTYTEANGVPKGYTLTATGYYFRPGGDDDDVSDRGAKAGDYVMSGGDMYHLTEAWTKLMGTCWKLTYTENATGKPASLSFSYDGGTTDINAIVTEKGTTTNADCVYNLQGQKVAEGCSLDNLSRGIYIMNGRKYVVK